MIYLRLIEKSKPTERWGRKATGPFLMAAWPPINLRRKRLIGGLYCEKEIFDCVSVDNGIYADDVNSGYGGSTEW